MGLGVEADDEGTPVGLVEAEKLGPGEAAVGDGDPVEGRGEEGEEIVDEFLLDLVLAEPVGRSGCGDDAVFETGLRPVDEGLD